MTKKRSEIDCPREPLGLRLEEAARFVGFSPSLFTQAVSDGVMPCPRGYKSAQIWDAEELAQAFRRLGRKTSSLRPGAIPPHDDISSEDDRWRPQT